MFPFKFFESSTNKFLLQLSFIYTYLVLFPTFRLSIICIRLSVSARVPSTFAPFILAFVQLFLCVRHLFLSIKYLTKQIFGKGE